MANRWFQQFRFSLEKKVVDLYGQVAIGATGAPTLSVVNSKGIKSIVRNGVGKYTITLQDTYQRLLDFNLTDLNAAGIPAAGAVGLVSAAVNTLAAPTVVFQLSNAGSATEAASGDVLYFQVSLSDTTAI